MCPDLGAILKDLADNEPGKQVIHKRIHGEIHCRADSNQLQRRRGQPTALTIRELYLVPEASVIQYLHQFAGGNRGVLNQFKFRAITFPEGDFGLRDDGLFIA